MGRSALCLSAPQVSGPSAVGVAGSPIAPARIRLTFLGFETLMRIGSRFACEAASSERSLISYGVRRGRVQQFA
jgi:hypothetical protein